MDQLWIYIIGLFHLFFHVCERRSVCEGFGRAMSFSAVVAYFICICNGFGYRIMRGFAWEQIYFPFLRGTSFPILVQPSISPSSPFIVFKILEIGNGRRPVQGIWFLGEG
jgi:hypothetical protein